MIPLNYKTNSWHLFITKINIKHNPRPYGETSQHLQKKKANGESYGYDF